MAKQKTTLKGLLKASGMAAVAGLVLSIPLGIYLHHKNKERVDYVLTEAARISVPLIAEFTAADPQDYSVRRDAAGNAKAVLFMKEYALPEAFKKDFKLTDITATVGVLDNAPFYQETHRFGPEDQLLVSAYDALSYANFSFNGLNYDNFQLHKSSGTLSNKDTIDKILLGVVSTIIGVGEEKEKIYA